MKDVFQVVTDRIISQLQKGVIPWQRTWSSNGPTSYQTNKEYQGINALILQDTYKSPYWLTFRQCQKLGGSIRAGEHGSPIVFMDRFVKEETEGRRNNKNPPYSLPEILYRLQLGTNQEPARKGASGAG